MSDVSNRYRTVAEQFTERLTKVPDDAWERPSPCEGWTARDVVRHLVDSASFFLGDAVDAPSVDDDPVAAWTAVRDTMQSTLDDPEAAGREVDTPMGRMTMEQLVARFGIGDVLVHTWDLARATGLDESLDGDEVRRLLRALEPFDEMIRTGGAFGPRIEVPGDADEQTKLIAFTGRRP